MRGSRSNGKRKGGWWGTYGRVKGSRYARHQAGDECSPPPFPPPENNQLRNSDDVVGQTQVLLLRSQVLNRIEHVYYGVENKNKDSQ